MKVINLRELAALDMTINGKRLIFFEFLTGALGSFVLAYLLKLNYAFIFWLAGTGANYSVLTWYALLLLGRNDFQEVGERIRNENQTKRYNLQQWLVLVPFFFVLIALMQELSIFSKPIK